MEQLLEELVLDYRAKNKVWQDLLQKESDKRDDLIAENDDETQEEPDDLRETLDRYADRSGLRDKQREALAELKEAERKLFAYQLDHCDKPQLRDELSRLSRDYAGRITWLRQFLEDEE